MSANLNPPLNPRKPVIPNGVVGMLFFIAAELMFFAAMVSAYMILRAGVPVWPPWGQPRLPVWTTAFNSLVLLASGVILQFARNAFSKEDIAKSLNLYRISLGAGVFFVLFQGYEWVQLIGFGLTMTSSNYGGIFYLIIGLHASHAIAALVGLFIVLGRLQDPARERYSQAVDFTTIQIFWYFVVGLWPILYFTVYIM